jgi:hypothetical protein
MPVEKSTSATSSPAHTAASSARRRANGAADSYLCEECFRAAHPPHEATVPGTFAAVGCWVWLALLGFSVLLYYAWLG